MGLTEPRFHQYCSDPSKRLFAGHFRFIAIDTKRPMRPSPALLHSFPETPCLIIKYY
jgi:hypothetical protein